MIIPTQELTVENVPTSDSSDMEIIRFAQSPNGYDQAGGDARDLAVYAAKLEEQPLDIRSRINCK